MRSEWTTPTPLETEEGEGIERLDPDAGGRGKDLARGGVRESITGMGRPGLVAATEHELERKEGAGVTLA